MAKIEKLALFILYVLFITQLLFPGEVKTVYLPADIKVEKNVFKKTFIRNLSELEIYNYSAFSIIDEGIYITTPNPPGIVKLSLQGKLLGKAGKKGEGPGEFAKVYGISKFDSNIGFLAYRRRVLIFYTSELKYVREIKFINHHMDFLVDRENNFVLFGAGEGRGFYFDKYSKDMVHIGSFGHSITTRSLWKKKKTFDEVRCALYVPEDNGIWASFKNRYDIRYYKNQKLAVEIKAEKGFFKTEEENFGGRIVVWVRNGSPICLAKSGSNLFYFFRNNGITYCDIYDLINWQLLRRIALKLFHRKISHYKDNIFYALCRDESEEDVQLFKLNF